MLQSQFSSMRGPIKALEADISHANALADTIQRAYGGACLHMRLSCNNLAPFFIFLMQCMDCPNLYCYAAYVERLTSNYSVFSVELVGVCCAAVIYPSLQQLESSMVDGEACSESGRNKEIVGMKRMEEWEKFSDDDLDREDECGICLEVCSKMVLPSCSHSMCLKCYRDWNVRSQSCPFCRGSLKRVRSRDLWVLTNNEDILDTMTLEKDNVRRFYRYIDSLPLMIPDNLFLVYYDYLI
ncbi:hypothetical protein ZIOFF_009687 [Zingiber officinale]|uniref:RING-type domain-containing protein n=1 Tax=Zingiber officinale TaxID=94328 RepID=A0A8J5HHP3_ZINOF|nr:hypothetical protein ZIOFF_009687 [Zingiber officinale]